MTFVPKKDETGERRYGRWAGRPNGYAEDKSCCAAEVPEGGRSCLFRQCARKRGHGPDGEFCRQHARMAEVGKP